MSPDLSESSSILSKISSDSTYFSSSLDKFTPIDFIQVVNKSGSRAILAIKALNSPFSSTNISQLNPSGSFSSS
ncbi:hypothetical protein HanRHA438_Chr13g0620591 [Helianthus annuus]|nr:hypothetical protein HanRHA438_Chr13g0620591 [Helianthus annuus]